MEIIKRHETEIVIFGRYVIHCQNSNKYCINYIHSFFSEIETEQLLKILIGKFSQPEIDTPGIN